MQNDVDFPFRNLNFDSDFVDLKNDLFVSPNNVCFVKRNVRKGIVSSILEEFLNTRIMIKKSLKCHSGTMKD